MSNNHTQQLIEGWEAAATAANDQPGHSEAAQALAAVIATQLGIASEEN